MAVVRRRVTVYRQQASFLIGRHTGTFRLKQGSFMVALVIRHKRVEKERGLIAADLR